MVGRGLPAVGSSICSSCGGGVGAWVGLLLSIMAAACRVSESDSSLSSGQSSRAEMLVCLPEGAFTHGLAGSNSCMDASKAWRRSSYNTQHHTSNLTTHQRNNNKNTQS